MALSSSDRISVDLQVLKVKLYERAQTAGVLSSALVRNALEDALVPQVASAAEPDSSSRALSTADSAWLSLRMSHAQASNVIEAALLAGMWPREATRKKPRSTCADRG